MREPRQRPCLGERVPQGKEKLIAHAASYSAASRGVFLMAQRDLLHSKYHNPAIIVSIVVNGSFSTGKDLITRSRFNTEQVYVYALENLVSKP